MSWLTRWRLLPLVLLLADVASAGELSGRVTARGSAVGDAVVFIEGPRTAAGAAETVVVDQRERRFVPHVTFVQVGATVLFPNHDTVHHNVFSFREGKPFDLGLYPVRSTRKVHFDRPG